MTHTHATIGLTEVLEGIDRDLDGLREKHQGDYALKAITMWWELEKERLQVRYGADARLTGQGDNRGKRRPAVWFFAGLAVGLLMLAGTLIV